MTSRHAITAVAIANCLGSRNEVVFARAFDGSDGFRPATAFFAFPFETELGVMDLHDEENGDDWAGCAPTRLARVALASARQITGAVQAAIERWGARRVAYVFSSSTGGLEQTERHLAPHPSLAGGLHFDYAYADHGIDATVAAFARRLGARGLQASVSTACSSGLKALATAARFIEHDLADAVVVASADSLCRTTIFGFASLGLLAPTATRPFGRDRCGITLGEGSAYLLLERKSPETARQALGWLAGLGARTDAFHQTSPHPEGVGAELAMRQALGRAGLEVADLDLVLAHATGTRLNDAVEGAALGRLLGTAVPVTATKSLTGHTLGSSGLTALVLAVEALRRQEIPATLRADPVDPSLGLTVISERTAARLDQVLVNAFGFGGSNASAVVSVHA